MNFNNIRRTILYLALAVVGVIIWNTWMKEHPPLSPKSDNSVEIKPSSSNFVPPSYVSSNTTQPSSGTVTIVPTTNLPTHGQLIQVKTDTLMVFIDLQGGNLVEAQLLHYPESQKKPQIPISILTSSPTTLSIAENGLKQNEATQTEIINFQTEKNQFALENNQKNLTVKLSGKTASGLRVVKIFNFERDKYNIGISYELENSGKKPWVGNIYQQIVRHYVAPKKSLHSRSYEGGAISSSAHPYEKISYKELKGVNINRDIQGGWIALQQPYFLTAWIPPAEQKNHYYSASSPDEIYTVGYVGPQIVLQPGEKTTQQSVFYVGPEIEKYLKNLAHGLDLTIDYGWLWMFSKIIFWVMDHVHSLVGNWGWSIIITTLLIKLLFYKLSEKSYRSMAKMREIQPRLQALKERFGDDKQAFSRATMEFYKKEKINPLGGCLPVIIQIPVFIALYYVLIESVQLRQAPFIFWIKDLSVHDPYYVLPILMGLSMFLQQRLSPPPPDPMQAKMMMFLPVIFTVFFLSFPAGLVLYWLVNNCASILQQWYVMKTYHPKDEKHKKLRKKIIKKK